VGGEGEAVLEGWGGEAGEGGEEGETLSLSWCLNAVENNFDLSNLMPMLEVDRSSDGRAFCF
jgi:hypothetical protein